MILTCPECRSRFLVDDTAFGPRARTVRCGKCRHQWQAEAPASLTPPIAAEPPSLIAKPIPKGSNLPVLPESRMAKIKPIAMAVVLLLVLAAGGWGLLTTAFGTVGLGLEKLPGGGLALSDVKTHYEQSGSGDYVLVVEGNIRNVGTTQVELPQVNVIIKDVNGGVLGSGVAAVQRPRLEAADMTGFVYTVDPVPEGMSDVTVEFAENSPTSEQTAAEATEEPADEQTP